MQYHPAFKIPDDADSYLWRYVDFTKFVAMLNDGVLYHSRADLLGDPFECSYPKANRDYYLTFPFHVDGVSKEEQPEEHERRRMEIAENNNNFMIGTGNFMAISCYINCWHLNQHESAAMWRLYLKNDEGIAIRTTVRRLMDSMKTDVHPIDFGEVRYIDYDSHRIDETNALNYVTHKRLSYSHEREFRSVIWLRNGMDTTQIYGINKVVDIPTLVESVFIAPTAPDWITKLVEDVSAKYGFDFEVYKSILAQNPLR